MENKNLLKFKLASLEQKAAQVRAVQFIKYIIMITAFAD